MSAKLRPPMITGQTPSDQVWQMNRYLHQLTQELQVAMDDIDNGTLKIIGKKKINGKTVPVLSDIQSEGTFESIKALIKKSDDIVSAYYGKMSRKLKGSYVEKTAFGTFTKETALALEGTAEAINQLYERIETVNTTTSGMADTVTSVSAHIRSGYLDDDTDGNPIYGVEIGQKTTIDGKEVFNKFARFSAGRLTFYDNEGNEKAYISDKKLHISSIELPEGEMTSYITESLSLTATSEDDIEVEVIGKKWSDGRIEGCFTVDLIDAGITSVSSSGKSIGITLPTEFRDAVAIVTLDTNIVAAASVNTASGFTIKVFTPSSTAVTPTRLIANVYLIKEA